MSWRRLAVAIGLLAAATPAWAHIHGPWDDWLRGGFVRWDAHDPMFREPWGRLHTRMPWVEPHNVRVPGDLVEVGALIGKVDGHVVSTCVKEDPQHWVHDVRDLFLDNRSTALAGSECARGVRLLSQSVRNLESAARTAPGIGRAQLADELEVSIQCAAAAIPLANWTIPAHLAARCPEKPVAVGTFDTAVWYLSTGFRERLCDLADRHRDDGVSFQIDGHTDTSRVEGSLDGGIVNNHQLGFARATQARDALVACGIAPERISVASYAETRPPIEGDNPRRVEVRVNRR